MRILRGVNTDDVHPALWMFLGAIATLHRQRTGTQLTVTSLRRPPGGRRSKHSPPPGELCTAADVRRWQLDETAGGLSFAAKLRALYGRELGVVLEPDELTADEIEERGGRDKVQPHLHVQLKGPLWPLLL